MAIPTTLGKYEITREIARSNDIVYEAYHPLTNRTVALKELAMPGGSTPQQRDDRIKRFMREARAAGSLAHPNIVTVYEVGEEAGRYFIAMEYLDGKTLANELYTKGFFATERAVEVATAVLEGLAYAHGKGVIHRDIKPDNIQLLSNGTIKVTDFGIARLTYEPNLTMDGQLFGTPSYMSPEQVVGGDIDERSDLFSVGVVLYEMLAGTKPFQGGSVVATTLEVVQKNPDRPQQVNWALWQVIEKSLSKKASDRFLNASTMLKALRDASAPTTPTFSGHALSALPPPQSTSFTSPAQSAANPGPPPPIAPTAPRPTRSLTMPPNVLRAFLAVVVALFIVELIASIHVPLGPSQAGDKPTAGGTASNPSKEMNSTSTRVPRERRVVGKAPTAPPLQPSLGFEGKQADGSGLYLVLRPDDSWQFWGYGQSIVGTWKMYSKIDQYVLRSTGPHRLGPIDIPEPWVLQHRPRDWDNPERVQGGGITLRAKGEVSEIQVREFLQRDNDFHITRNDFFPAIENNDLGAVKAAIDNKVDVNKPYRGMLPLNFACAHEETDIVRLLLASGADSSKVDKLGQPLFIAIKTGNRQLIDLLCGSANLNQAEHVSGYTAMHYAVLAHDIQWVQLLISKGCDPGAKSADGVTPLMLAGEKNQTEIALALISAGASKIDADNRGKTAFDYATDYPDLQALLKHGDK